MSTMADYPVDLMPQHEHPVDHEIIVNGLRQVVMWSCSTCDWYAIHYIHVAEGSDPYCLIG